MEIITMVMVFKMAKLMDYNIIYKHRIQLDKLGIEGDLPF